MTRIPNTAEIKLFVTTQLGCGCPDSVFEQVDYDPAWLLPGSGQPMQRLLIGQRLLIYLLAIDVATDLPVVLPRLVEVGRLERDRNGYNRLRIVIASTRTEAIRAVAEGIFAGLAHADENVHLHVLQGSGWFGAADDQDETIHQGIR